MSPLPLPEALDIGPSGSDLVVSGYKVTPIGVDGPIDIAKKAHPLTKPVTNCSKLERGDGNRGAHPIASGHKCELVQSTHGPMVRPMPLEQSLGVTATRALAMLGMFVTKLRTTKDNEIKVEK